MNSPNTRVVRTIIGNSTPECTIAWAPEVGMIKLPSEVFDKTALKQCKPGRIIGLKIHAMKSSIWMASDYHWNASEIRQIPFAEKRDFFKTGKLKENSGFAIKLTEEFGSDYGAIYLKNGDIAHFSRWDIKNFDWATSQPNCTDWNCWYFEPKGDIKRRSWFPNFTYRAIYIFPPTEHPNKNLKWTSQTPSPDHP